MPSLCFILLGPPGSGKGTQGILLSKKFDAYFFSTGELLRTAVNARNYLGRKIKPILATGGVVPTNLLMPILEKAISNTSNEKTLFLDFAGTEKQCEMLDEILTKHHRTIRATFLIEIPREEILKRLLSRKRKDDNLEIVDERISIYNQEIVSVRKYYEELGLLYIINGKGTPNEVNERLITQINILNK